MVNGTTTRNTKNNVMIAMVWIIGIEPRMDIQKQLVSDISMMVKEFGEQLHP